MQKSFGFCANYFEYASGRTIDAFSRLVWRQRVVICAALLLFGFVNMEAEQGPAVAQWQGVLQNAGRAPIADATIRLNSGANTAESVTGKDGRFAMQNVPIGRYRLTVKANGRSIEDAQSVEVAQGAAAVAIELSDRGELTLTTLQNQAGTGGEALSSQAVSELPLNN